MNPAVFQLPERLEALAAFDAIIDVRSPAEFAEDHLDGALNCPVLDDRQRAEVGTLYKQVSPFAARRIGAALVAENIARHLRERFADHPKSWRPLIYCWRGGQRSGSMTLVLRQIGWNAQQLEGGYKAYRRHVIDRLASLPERYAYRVISGATGSAKSRVLQSLERQGAQVLDLEELACHKGSVLGVLPGTPQPSQKRFESLLMKKLAGLDPERPVFVEAESRKIGALQVPDALIAAMRESPCVTIDVAVSARVEFLLRDYAYFLGDVDRLLARLDALRGLRGHAPVDRWASLARDGAWTEFVTDLLVNHYDPLYFQSQNRNYRGHDGLCTIAASDLSETGIDSIATTILRQQAEPVTAPASRTARPGPSDSVPALDVRADR